MSAHADQFDEASFNEDPDELNNAEEPENEPSPWVEDVKRRSDEV